MEDEVVLHLPQDIHKLCRTCMAVTENVLSHDILLIDDNQSTLAGEMIEFCFSIKAEPNDGLPMSICDDCAYKLESAYNFKNQCVQTEEGLKKLLNLSSDEETKNTKKQLIKHENNEDEQDKMKGVTLFESNLRKNYSQDVPELNPEITINFEAIFKKSNILNDTAIEEEEQEEINIKTENNFEDENILSLVQERKEYTNIKIKKELLSDDENDDETNIICEQCNVLFAHMSDFEKHNENCKNQAVLDRLFKIETNDLKHYDISDNEGKASNECRTFTCNECGREFLTKHARNIHMSVHGYSRSNTGPNTFICDLCNKGFPTDSKLISHFYKHVSNIRKGLQVLNSESGEFTIKLEDEHNLLACNICQEQFDNEDKLKSHTEDHMKTGIECEICNTNLIGEMTLVKHLKQHGINICICKICLKRFENPIKLKEHQKSHQLESTNSQVTCPICKENFGNLTALKNHSLSHLNDVYSCDRCSRHFNNKIVYENHMKQHLEPRFLCSLCGKQYFSSVTLACHIRVHNNEKPFECPHCKKRFTSRATLSVHKRIHSELKPYVCNYCAYSCRQSGDLAMHIRTHTGIKPYKCKFPNCERKFTTSSQRMEHHRRHTNERNHKCKVCGKAFLESKTLKVHMLTHTGEKPHECKVCGRRFRRTHHLANHMKGHKDYCEVKEVIQIF